MAASTFANCCASCGGIWRIVIATPLILLAAALVFVMSVQPLYTGTATVLIDPRRASIVDTTNNHPVLSNFNTDDVTTESQVMLIQSVTVLQRVVDTLKLTEDPEFQPTPGILDPIKALFASSKPDYRHERRGDGQGSFD